MHLMLVTKVFYAWGLVLVDELGLVPGPDEGAGFLTLDFSLSLCGSVGFLNGFDLDI